MSGDASGMQPPFGPAPAPLQGKELPSFRYPLGAQPMQTYDGGGSREATVVNFPVSEKLAGVYMTLAAGRLARIALARQCRRMGLCDPRPLPRHHHRSARAFRDRRFRPRRRLVFPARSRPFDPGARPGRLRVHPGFRQRIFLGFRHLQHHRLDRPCAGFGAGQEFRRAGRDLRQFSEEGSLYRQGSGAAAVAGRSRAGLAQHAGADASLSFSRAEAAGVSGRHLAGGVRGRIPDLHDDDRRACFASSRAGCANCIGIPMPTSGNII